MANLAELAVDIQSVIPDTASELLDEDLEAAALAGEAAAMGAAPVLTGALRDSITVEFGGGEVAIGSPLDYADVQEERHGYLEIGLSASISELHRLGYQ